MMPRQPNLSSVCLIASSLTVVLFWTVQDVARISAFVVPAAFQQRPLSVGSRAALGSPSHLQPLVQVEAVSSSSSSTNTAAASTAAGEDIIPQILGSNHLDFTLGYLNKHHGGLLAAVAEFFSPLGVEMAKKNAWSGGSMAIESATIVDIDTQTMTLDVVIQQRSSNAKEPRQQRVVVDLDARPVIKRLPSGAVPTAMEPVTRLDHLVPTTTSITTPLDDVIRRLCRLCWLVGQPTVTGKLVQLGIQLQQPKDDDAPDADGIHGSSRGKLKENLYLNQVPHNRYVRKYFYDMAANAVLDSVVLCSQGKVSNRLKVTSMFPETNPSMDSYRIGTLLELTRALALRLVEQNLRVRVCVQGSMGVGIFTGLPKQLGGVAKLLQLMDWQSGPGEENEGMVGTYLNFGSVGAEHVVNAGEIPKENVDNEEDKNDDGESSSTTPITTKKVEQDDVFLIVAPQSMVGVDSSIIGPLQEMAEAAGDRPVILINPDLTDKVSAQGQQNVRGRQQRLDFANSFETAWHFQNIYVSGTSYFPILGSIFKPGPQSMWIAHQRRDLVNNQGEVYVPVLAGEHMPTGEQILEAFES